ncbi:hypothetical protein XENOCAPTIV_020651 [Xenoophorus captivus]|uniref:Uncharacterized protein n=1 Tax=Xenoophorus captivus TaxID=1517983 RepID=A0ABV0S925_9TELE
MAASSFSSPFYRPWEEPASCGVSHSDIRSSLQKQSTPSMFHVSASTYPDERQLYQQTSTLDVRLDTAKQPFAGGKEISFEGAHRSHDDPTEADTQTAHGGREQFLMESVNRMMTELEFIKEQATSSSFRRPYPSEQLYNNHFSLPLSHKRSYLVPVAGQRLPGHYFPLSLS